MTVSDKIDRIVTNRILGLPIFILTMFIVYYVSVTTVGTMVTDWTNDSFVGTIQGVVADGLSGVGVADWLVSLVSDGIIGGLGAVLGFVPQMAILFLFLSILEDFGYTVYSVISDFPERALSRSLSPQVVESLESWLPKQSRLITTVD